MKITRENYEAFFIDYLEGTLENRLVDDFIEFLQQNPDLKQELSLFESIETIPESVSFPQKEKLYKEKLDAENEFNKAAVAQLEGDLSDVEKKEFENYVKSHPEKQKDLVLFSKTKLFANENIVFARKQKLYRRSLGKTLFIWSGRVAAVILLGFVLYSVFSTRTEPGFPENKVAEIVENPAHQEAPSEQTYFAQEPQKNQVESVEESNPVQENKTVFPVTKTSNKLPEIEKDIVEDEKNQIRIPVDVPDKLMAINASMNALAFKTSMVEIQPVLPEIEEYYADERLLTDVVIEKTGLDKFRFSDIPHAGLKLIQNLSKDKFQYKLNEDGKVTDYKYDSRLLAFSVNTKNAELEHDNYRGTAPDSE